MIESKGIIHDEENYDRKSELIAFDETKAGVKGLVDAGVTCIPRIFIHPPELSDRTTPGLAVVNKQLIFPSLIDLNGIEDDPIRYKQVVESIRDASGSWGFFQVVNHGVADCILEEMIDGTRRFFEQDIEGRKQWYTRDITRKVVHNSNFDLFISPAANWRDSFYSYMAGPDPPKPEELPEACRDIMIEYSKQVMKLACKLLRLLSEGLGLDPSRFLDMGCAEGLGLICHYYPACPQPELTMGTTRHADNTFITILLQDHLGGLQVFHDDQWIDVPPIRDALVVNIGDLLQLISNDALKSVEHRVLARNVGPRISVASFIATGTQESSRVYEPVKELLTEETPAKYRATTAKEFAEYLQEKGLDGKAALPYFRL